MNEEKAQKLINEIQRLGKGSGKWGEAEANNEQCLALVKEHIKDIYSLIDEAIGCEDIEQLREDAGEIPENTCPNIDKLISEHNTLIKELEHLERGASKYDSAEELVKDFPSTWTDVENIAEQLRRDNEQLRSLGKFWYEAYKNLITNLEQLKK